MWVQAEAFFEADADVDTALQSWLSMDYQQSSDAFRRQIQAILGHNAVGDLDRITCPTLILVGDQEHVFSIGDSQRLHREIAQSKLDVIADAGHNVWM